MGTSYTGTLVELLGAVAREARSGRLLLAGEAGGSLGFSKGELASFTPPEGQAIPTSAKGGAGAMDIAALRQRICQAALMAASRGVNPRILPPAGASDGALGMTAADLVIDLCRQIDDASWLKERILDDDDGRLGPPSSPQRVQPRVALGPSEGFLLSRADGSVSLAQILATTPFGEIETLRTLFAFKTAGLLRSASRANPPSAAAAAGRGNLLDLDRFLKKTAQGAPRAEPRHREAPGAEDVPSPVDTSSPYTPQQQREREELLARCRASGNDDHYMILGVERTAPEEAIRRAYYQLARRYHPDRLHRPHLEDIHLELEGMFATITEAYNTLSDPPARGEYDRELAEWGAARKKDPTLDKQAAAREAYLRGRKLMDAGKTFEAIRLFETAVNLEPGRAEHFHFLGVCQAQNPRWKKKAEENLLKAIAMNPSSAQSFLELARLYKKGGLERRAAETYEAVLKWDPTNEEALAALGRQKDSMSSTGIFRGIFKKD